ncbi:nucleoid-associated protein [Vibrio cholerae]|uniref:nucleoid-associated protein n=1 Tax=Vibrio cholerae TaxID=666 RepID=UPI003080DA0E|nr:nucleoid-associated protein [Vibrio cholerae]EJL6548747.1 nucleoid-associated protein [Vibrio cholerae]EKF9237522.1 nucleoid-associated protein [Vibrio cholerae]
MATPLVVLNAIAAEVNKQDGRFGYDFGDVWDGGNEHALNFVQEIETKFRRKTKTYGFLNLDTGRNSIPTILTDFNADTENAFESMARNMMERLKSSLNEDGRGNTQVGHMVFIHYCNEGEEEDLGRLLVVMVDKKDVFDFGAGLVPTRFKSIDVDTLRQAVMYDLTLFDSVYPEHVEEHQDKAYLRFISGRSKGQFFQEALGTNDMIDNTVSVSSIFDAIAQFGKELGIRTAHIRKIQDEVELLINDKKGKQVSISSVAKKVVSNLPENNDVTTAEEFVSFINANDYKISEIFDVTRGQLQKATNIEGQKGMDYYYRIKKSALGAVNDMEKSIRYDAGTRIIYIEIQDEEQHRELLEALPSRD